MIALVFGRWMAGPPGPIEKSTHSTISSRGDVLFAPLISGHTSRESIGGSPAMAAAASTGSAPASFANVPHQSAK
jgi:hypothetical protein